MRDVISDLACRLRAERGVGGLTAGPCVKGAAASRPYKEKQDDFKRVDT